MSISPVPAKGVFLGMILVAESIWGIFIITFAELKSKGVLRQKSCYVPYVVGI